MQTIDFFLGALSPSGFTGWFAEAAAEPDIQAYLLKSGPGCGKSTFLKRMAQDAGQAGKGPVQLIHCSSDPNSLDGIFVAGAHAFLADATAPHTLNCKYPGAAECVVSLYDTLDNAALHRCRKEILSLGGRNAALLQAASAHFALACGLLQRRRQTAGLAVQHAELAAFGRRLAKRTMPAHRTAVPGKQQIRLLSAPTPGGSTVFYDTIPALADHLYVIQDSYGAVSGELLAILAEAAQRNGYNSIVCRCPTDQVNRIDHLFIPELRLAFLTANFWHPMLFLDQKNIHATRWMNRAVLNAHRVEMSAEKRMACQLMDETCHTLDAALAVHDALEKFYISAADFSRVEEIRCQLRDKILSEA